jgi:hypothetical protein
MGVVPWDHVTGLKGKRCKLIIAYEIFCIIDQSNITVARIPEKLCFHKFALLSSDGIRKSSANERPRLPVVIRLE